MIESCNSKETLYELELIEDLLEYKPSTTMAKANCYLPLSLTLMVIKKL